MEHLTGSVVKALHRIQPPAARDPTVFHTEESSNPRSQDSPRRHQTRGRCSMSSLDATG